MLRALLFGVLSLGAARLAWSLSREPAVLEALGGGTPETRRFDYPSFEPLVSHLAAQDPPDRPVFVLAPDSAAFGWIRYLAYPRRIDLLPAAGRDALGALPEGTSFIVLPFARDGDDVAAQLRARSGAARVERVLAREGAFALYRVQR